MQTELLPQFLETPEGREADAILRACVHCGFCTATCPTYQLLGDELDGPRGRIYQIKLVLEGQQPTRVAQRHLDRCLSCRSCETTCPSGVRYGRLADIGRQLIEREVRRPLSERLVRTVLLTLIPRARHLRPLLALARALRPVLPAALRAKVPAHQRAGEWPAPRGRRRMLTLAGCVQSLMTPRTNAAAARLLDQLGIDLVTAPEAGCCGAVSWHLNDRERGLAAMRRNVDAWCPEVEAGAEVLVINASGCAAFVREYGELLAHDPHYAARAAHISALVRDPVEVLESEDLSALGQPGRGRRVAYHASCTQQHGLKLRQRVEPVLERLGFVTTPVPDAHLCCGSAGTYSITQPALSAQLLADKQAALASGAPDLIATGNIGCQLHLASSAERPVVHWLDLLDPQVRPELDSH